MSSSFHFDGREVPFEEGDRVAEALWRAGERTIARSMKYHRPRGPYCFVGTCAGCQVNVDGVPNQRACMTPASAGLKVQSQNTMGSAKRDLLGAVDKVYKEHFDPHHAFTWSKLVNAGFLKGVRFMSGLGKAPAPGTEVADVGQARAAAPTTLVVGGGRRGLVAALQAAKTGSVLLVDEQEHLGGDRPDATLIQQVQDHASIEVLTSCAAFGIYGELVGLDHEGTRVEVRADHVILALGGHDAWPLFEGNDRPGVITERAAEVLLDRQILPGTKIVVHGRPMELALLERIEAMGGRIVAQGHVQAVEGHPIRRVQVEDAWVEANTVIVHLPRLPRIELAQQAGCELHFQHGALRAVVDAEGRTSVPHITMLEGRA